MKEILIIKIEDLKEANIPKNFWKLGHNNYPGSFTALKKVQKYVHYSTKVVEEGTGLTFIGETRSCKTFLMTYALKCLITKNHTALYMPFRKMCDIHFEFGGAFEDRFTEPEFLGIDNLTFAPNQGEKEAFMRLLCLRKDQGLPLLLSTVFSKEDFALHYGETSLEYLQYNSVFIDCHKYEEGLSLPKSIKELLKDVA